MGHFENGQWVSGWYKSDKKGHFVRPDTTFRSVAEPVSGRYRLYLSLACPWAHRTLIARSLLGLQEHLPVTVVDWFLDDDGWRFFEGEPEPLFGFTRLRELYLKADPQYTGRVTVPVLWDVERATIVQNESRDILRQLCTVFKPLSKGRELSPESLRGQIDEVLDDIYAPINNGVYRCGFAATQEAYDEAVAALYSALDRYEERLSKQPYLCGQELTEADICLFTTLVRFDPVYSVHFKCSRKRIRDYEDLDRFLKAMYHEPGVAETVDFEHIRKHYYVSHDHINPRRIVAAAPEPLL